MDIDEPVSFGSRNNYGDIQVAWKNEFTPYSRQVIKVVIGQFTFCP